MLKDVPVVGLAGYSGSGKTTFLEKLLHELKQRGYTIGVIKHTHHQVEFDQPGKDTWRHARAGADVVALAAPGGVSLVKKFGSLPEPEDVITMLGDVDIVIIEGYKNRNWPKIEVLHRNDLERPSISEEDLLGVVSREHPGGHVPWFDLDDAAGVADLIESKIIINKR